MILENFDNSIKTEILKYTENMFESDAVIPEEIPDEPFIDTFKDLINEIKSIGIKKALNENFPHGDSDIDFKNEDDVTLEIYKSMAGNIPIFYAKNVNDFEELVRKLIHKGKPVPNIGSIGASFAHGKNLRFIILSNKPYSNVDAKELDLPDKTWKDFSMIIRREHECTHYFTKRFLGSSRNNIHDELIADFAGIVSACGEYKSKWFLRGMGIDEFPKEQPERRFPVYTKELSDGALDAMKQVTIKASNNVEKWFKTAGDLTLLEKILFLSKKNLLELCGLYD